MERMFILDFKHVGISEFILFWKDYYNEGKYPDDKYEYHLKKGGIVTPDGLLYLLEWKNGNTLSGKKKQIYRAAVENLDKLMDFRKREPFNSKDVVALLEVISGIIKTGLIWRVFLMHITRPEDFPMFDQHVYRSFFFLENGKIIDTNFTDKDIALYHQYLCFVTRVNEGTGIELRTIDKALFAFGKFIKEHKAQIEKVS